MNNLKYEVRRASQTLDGRATWRVVEANEVSEAYYLYWTATLDAARDFCYLLNWASALREDSTTKHDEIYRDGPGTGPLTELRKRLDEIEKKDLGGQGKLIIEKPGGKKRRKKHA